MSLCFIRGAGLPDPHRLLQGSGSQTRFVRLPVASVIADPGVEALLCAAIARSPAPFRARGTRKLIIRSASAKQRPRQ